MVNEQNWNRLNVRQIAKSFKSKNVVHGVSMHVDSGEVIGLLGPNGAGKTTCFNMVIGLEQCDSGSVWLNDLNITNLPIYARARLGVGYLPQESSVFRRLNVEENVRAVLESQRNLSPRERTERVEWVLEEFSIMKHRKQDVKVLSGGLRRRVEMARAFALLPRFILLDEPFAGVDPVSVDDVVQLIFKLADSNVGILITDHNVRETLSICTRTLIMSEGTIIAEGDANEILQDDRVKQIYLGQKFAI